MPRLEQFTIDVDQLQRTRDRLVDALTGIGLSRRAAGGHVLPLGALAARGRRRLSRGLTKHDIFVMPGYLFETPGFFRISLTANDDMIERSLPGFAAAIKQAQTEKLTFIST